MMKKLTLQRIILFLALLFVSNGLIAQELRLLLAEANTCVSKHQNARAEQLFKKAIKSTNPTDIDLYLVYTNLGAVQQRMKKNKQALLSYNNALLLKPTSLNALNNRGTLKLEMKDYGGAMNDFNAAIQLDSLKEDAFINRSYLHKIMKDTAAAIRDLKSALRIKPYNVSARNSYATILMRQGKLDDALKMFTSLVEEFPSQPIMLYNMAQIYNRMKKYGQALSYANRTLRLNPTYDAAYIVRAEIYLATDDHTLAKKDLKKAISIGNKDPKAKQLLALCK